MTTFGDLSSGVAAGVALLLIVYLSLYPALVAHVIGRGVRAFGPRALWAAPPVWAAGEWARGHVMTGFPWVPLGNSQIDVTPIAQAASLVGVYGLSALVVLGSVALAWIVVGPPGRGRVGAGGGGRRADRGPGLVGRGARRARAISCAPARRSASRSSRATSRRARSGTPPSPTRSTAATWRCRATAVARGATLVMWPESATPFIFEEHPAAEAMRLLARETGARLFVGSDQIERGAKPRYLQQRVPHPADRVGRRHLPQDAPGAVRRVRAARVDPVVRGAARRAGRRLRAGETLTVFRVREGAFTTGICYEAVFPELSREAVQRGSQLLTSITNDAWFGRSSAPWQHLAMARMRSVETGRYLARAANTGVSAIVDPYGRVVQATPLFEETVSVGEVRFLDGTTLYVRIGDVVPWAGLVVAIGLWVLSARGRRRPASASPPPSGDPRAVHRS